MGTLELISKYQLDNLDIAIEKLKKIAELQDKINGKGFLTGNNRDESTYVPTRDTSTPHTRG